MSETTTKQGTVTIVFTDLEGSTDLRNQVGDEAAQEIVRAHEQLTREVLTSCGGVEEKALGDGFMVSFGSARKAVTFAVTLQRRVDEHNQANSDKKFKVRVGMNTGEVTSEGEDLYGAAVNAASRVCGKAQGGQILIPLVVRDLAGVMPNVRVVDRGLFWLKGFPTRWRLFEVMWREKGAGRDEDRRPMSQVASEVLDLPREQSPVVGRVAEQGAIHEELDLVKDGRLRAVSVEGEAGIGKTRLMEAAAMAASDKDFGVLRASADEELRGPFLLCRTVFALPAIESLAHEAGAIESLQNARDAITGADPHTQGLAPAEQMLHIFDEAAGAIRNLATSKPLALLLDDVQWADEDSLKLIRYLVRTLSSAPIFLMMTVRSHQELAGGAVVHLLADLERMHLARRLQLDRFTRAESAELLSNLLGGQISQRAAASLHKHAEGVPFFIEEFARAYREAGVLQNVGGIWSVAESSGTQVPASVQTLIERRLAQVDSAARAVLSDAAVLGRRFKLEDLAQIASGVGQAEMPSDSRVWELAEMLEPAVALGVIIELPEGSQHDFAFTHDQVRSTLASSISRTRRRLIHGSIARMLAQRNDPQSLSALAHHALQAGDEKLGVECSIKAARSTLEAHAPEESVRIVDAARAAATTPEIRAELLRIKDDALTMLDKGEERAANLAEMSALASAIGDPAFEIDVKLRRASTSHMIGDFDTAWDIAKEVRDLAESTGDRAKELAASMEMGQAALRAPLGESYVPLQEVDLDLVEEPFDRAARLARELGDRPTLAAALRELAVVRMGRVKDLALEILAETGGNMMTPVFFDPAIEKQMEVAKEYVTESLRIYEELGDQRGVMSSLISLAYTHVTDLSRRGEAGRLEQIRRLRSSFTRMTTETQKAIQEAQTLYSIHVYARSHLILDLALLRGAETYNAARAIGDRWLEFLSAGGMAESHLGLMQIEPARSWLDRAANIALSSPAPAMSRRLELWRGLLAAAENRGEDMVEHLEAVVKMAIEHVSQAGRCEALALLAMCAARLGTEQDDEFLLDRALKAAAEARQVAETLPGELPWTSRSWAAESLVALHKSENEKAAEASRTALASMEPRFMRALYLDVLWVAAKALISTQAPEGPDLTAEIQENFFLIDSSMVDPAIKAAWIEAPMHAELAAIAGYGGFKTAPTDTIWLPAGMEEIEMEILKELTSGKSDPEIAAHVNATEDELVRHMDSLYSKLGVTTRTGATEFALREGIV